MEDEISFKMTMGFKHKTADSVRTETNSDVSPNLLTKRKVLSYISAIFDPMGFVAPVTLHGKLLMRQVTEYTDENGQKLD